MRAGGNKGQRKGGTHLKPYLYGCLCRQTSLLFAHPLLREPHRQRNRRSAGQVDGVAQLERLEEGVELRLHAGRLPGAVRRLTRRLCGWVYAQKQGKVRRERERERGVEEMRSDNLIGQPARSLESLRDSMRWCSRVHCSVSTCCCLPESSQAVVPSENSPVHPRSREIFETRTASERERGPGNGNVIRSPGPRSPVSPRPTGNML